VVTQKLIGGWLVRNKRDSIALTVAHSHAHGDHVAGDKGFAGMANTTLVAATVEAAQSAFGIQNWPEQAGAIDLGDRVIDVLAIPGHQAAHLAYYDRRTGILLTGDHLYPGRLYVTDFPAYQASTRRLVDFTATRPVAHIFGCHIEQTSTPFVDYPVGTQYQPHEHSLDLGRGHLLELMDGLEAMKDKVARVLYRDFTIWPREPRK
jgi:glyoxylase-like metal-dependent hydrolase (beta-lactamase superfamily II)